MASSFTIRDIVRQYPGPSGRYFIKTSAAGLELLDLKTKTSEHPRYIKVKARLGVSEWHTVLFPTTDGAYLLAIEHGIAVREGIKNGQRLSVRMELLS
jgi:hypothetical protein